MANDDNVVKGEVLSSSTVGLAGTNGLQRAVDSLSNTVGKLSQASQNISNAAKVMNSQPAGGGGNGGTWNVGARAPWAGTPNGGGATYGGTTPPGIGGSGGSGGGGNGGIGKTLAAGGAARAAGMGGAAAVPLAITAYAAKQVGRSFQLGWGSYQGIDDERQGYADWYSRAKLLNGGLSGEDLTRGQFNFGTSNRDAQKASEMMSGYSPLRYGSEAQRMQARDVQAFGKSMGYSAVKSVESYAAWGSMNQANTLARFGVFSFSGGKQQTPQNIANQILRLMGNNDSIPWTEALIEREIENPVSQFTYQMNIMMESGAISPEQAAEIKQEAKNILKAQSKNVTNKKLAELRSKAQSKNRDVAKKARADLKKIGIEETLTQREQEVAVNKGITAAGSGLEDFTDLSKQAADQLGDFQDATRGATEALRNIEAIWKGNFKSGGLGSRFDWSGGLSGIFGHGQGNFGSGTPGVGSGGGGASAGTGSSGTPATAAGGFSQDTGGPRTAGSMFSESGVLSSALASGTAAGVSQGAVAAGQASLQSMALAASMGTQGGGTESSGGGTSGGGGTGSAYGTGGAKAVWRVTPAMAIAKIRGMMRAKTNIGKGLCQKNVRLVYGIGGGAPSAADAWKNAKYKHSMRESPPVGAFIFWTGGSSGYGHVAIYAGGGKVYSPGGPSDWYRWTLDPISSFGSSLNLVGWTEDNNGVRVIKPNNQQVNSGSKGSASYSGVNTNVKSSPNQNRAIGKSMAAARGWTGSQWRALETLWTRESGWNHQADNPTSSAYGIPQALVALHKPKGGYYGRKVSGSGGSSNYVGGNPSVQIRWGLDYIKGRYGTPARALAYWNAHHSYAIGAERIDEDRLAKVHKDEMILPADLARSVRYAVQNRRKSIDSGGPGIVFNEGAIKITVGAGATTSQGRAVGKSIVDAIVNDNRIKDIQNGTM